MGSVAQRWKIEAVLALVRKVETGNFFVAGANDSQGKTRAFMRLLDFDYSEVHRIVQELEVEDYSEGPLFDNKGRPHDLWVFGAYVRKYEVYIKFAVYVTQATVRAICAPSMRRNILFHIHTERLLDMTQTKWILCPECWEEVHATYEVRHHVEEVRGVTVEADVRHLICPKCGDSIGWTPLVDEGLHKIYRAYQEKMGLMLPEEIVALRKRYGFSQRVFAAILDIGVASLQRYERGCLATDAHAQLLASARDPRFLRARLESGARKLSDEEREKALSVIKACGISRVDYAVVKMDVLGSIVREKTQDTGMRLFGSDRVREAIVYLAAHVHDLYRTKLNKVLFYLDFATYRREGCGFTGLRYAKADFGPVPDQYELLLAALVDDRALSLREQGDGQVIVAGRGADLSGFSPSEVSMLDAVCAFANGFASTSALSEFSHGERGWRETEPGAIISYEYAAELLWAVG